MKYAMLQFREEISKEVKRVLATDVDIPFEIPSEDRGDYAVPCFSFSPLFKKSPQEIAGILVDEIELNKGGAEQAGPYVNFRINEEHLVKETIYASLREKFGWFEPNGEEVLIEHTSANPNAPLHVGNARNPVIGDTVARIFKRLGHDVTTEYYVDDMGRQVAMLTWGLANLSPSDVEKPKLDKPDHELMIYYQKVASLMDDESVKEGVHEVIRLMESGDEETIRSFRENSEKVLSGHIASLERLNITHDNFKTESSLIAGGDVREVIEALRELPLCGEDEGALYMEWDGHRVYFARGDGTSLYPARDVAYHIDKTRRTDRLIDVLGEDHKMHALSIIKAMDALNVHPLPEIIFYSFVSLEGEKMSTRSGRSVWLDGLMDTAHQRAKEEILSRRDDMASTDVEDIAEAVGMGAVRFNIIKVQPEKSMDFRWKDALNFQGSSAPFVQYSHARAASIIRKWGGDVESLKAVDPSVLSSTGEIRLVKKMAQYPGVLLESATAPHLLANYALRLAAEFNQFYRDHPVLQAEGKRSARLALVLSFKNIIKEVLDALGISAPEHM
ncbi:MAG: arginine--tRNA ligase [Thermoplasmata archaeon]